MLTLKNITKVYRTESLEQTALNNISISFRKSEFVSILGQSGSGKTTLLNIIGGLDQYTSGDLIINGISTKKYKDRDWDTYRNHRVGFIFQSYNLISHQTILKNVELALTLSGVSNKERREKAILALEEVGLGEHINKKPNQLSGGQMQRVAIARALINNPEIILADEPTGALDSQTSIQIMDLLKKIANDRLVIMVTHNPELAKEYSTRIVELKDGVITSDSKKYIEKDEKEILNNDKNKKTSMSFFTALSLSYNNLLTKKGRTILVSLAGSIGIIGIALILALSTGFQNYIDKIQEDTLSSYPLTIASESSDLTSLLLSLTTGSSDNDNSGTVKEQQFITSMLSSISTNDLKYFKKYLNNNYSKIESDISSIKYSYSVDPLIYTIDKKNNLSKINPSSLMSSIYSSSVVSSYSSMSSIFNQMIDDTAAINENYDILAGRLPEKYDEMIIVLQEPNKISDLLVYSLGLRDTKELSTLIQSVMSGEETDINNEPLTITYEELLNLDFRLILPTDTYKYNSKYKIYEDMSSDETYMNNLYKNATKLKIVGILSSKEGSSSTALSQGVGYRSDLIEYIVNSVKDTDIVKKQLSNENIDVFSNTKFDEEKTLDLDFSDLIKVDTNKMQKAFGMNINEDDIKELTSSYMTNISSNITTDTSTAYNELNDLFKELSYDMFDNLIGPIKLDDVSILINNYLSNEDVIAKINILVSKYYLPKDTYINTFNSLLTSMLTTYINTYNTNFSTTESEIVDSIYNPIIESTLSSLIYTETINTIAKYMTEAKMQKDILSNVGTLSNKLITMVASSFNVDTDMIASAFTFDMSDDELSRIMSAMTDQTETNQYTNLLKLGYQDLDKPTMISFYFNSFDNKEHFIEFIDEYNELMENSELEDKVINYTDTTGILMGSVKTIVNSVSYVLIAFVSISLVVSSIMIGIITYISVYERTKEIGILRSIGASKRNISSIFNAETFIVGLLSGLFGIGITYILIPIINMIIHNLTGNVNISAFLDIFDATKLIILSIILTLIGGLIPSRSASKRNPVEALRTD